MAILSEPVKQYLADIEAKYPGALRTREGRIKLTRTRPKLFAILFLSDYVTNQATGMIEFSAMHEEWYKEMESWMVPMKEEAQWRHAFVAPRESAKSTTWTTIGPLWAAAHGHAKVAVVISETETQAMKQLEHFVLELDDNAELRAHFPDLCTPKQKLKGGNKSQSKKEIQQSNGFTFFAKGILSSMAGLRQRNIRPDLFLCDDIEPLEGDYSLAQMLDYRSRLIGKILPLNQRARMAIMGTVAINGSIIHQLNKTVTNPGEAPEDWITAGNFKAHYYPCIITKDDGSEESIWPSKYSWSWIERNRHTNDFAKNYMNQPVSDGGQLWKEEDFVLDEDKSVFVNTLISLDPAGKLASKNDYTGIAVLSYDFNKEQMTVRECLQVKLGPEDLKNKIMELKRDYPETRYLLLEVSGAGSMYITDNYKDIGFPTMEVSQHKGKYERAEYLAAAYQRGDIKHAKDIPQLKTQMLSFPKGANDDMIDAVGTGYIYFNPPTPKTKEFSVEINSYV